MSLKEYSKKRDFQHTPEPEGLVEVHTSTLVFVVQKHQASQLHFDFRLESDGVLKSWAVPKGPSMNPSDKRLAVLVEDHPLEYASFAGEIPEGNYGAGTVEIWDTGYWTPGGDFSDVEKALEDGVLEFILHGEKLQGKFALIQLKKSKIKNGWLLVKKKDAYAVSRPYDAYEQ
ncbi:MAG: 3'-phosphoesterase [Tannerellaceae bacterium]|nr:3'-phosphoesterase [Tannerellaceae bacterium]